MDILAVVLQARMQRMPGSQTAFPSTEPQPIIMITYSCAHRPRPCIVHGELSTSPHPPDGVSLPSRVMRLSGDNEVEKDAYGASLLSSCNDNHAVSVLVSLQGRYSTHSAATPTQHQHTEPRQVGSKPPRRKKKGRTKTRQDKTRD